MVDYASELATEWLAKASRTASRPQKTPSRTH